MNVTLRRLTPDIRRVDLGYLRLWRDDLAEIVDLVGQLNDVKIDLEAGVPKEDGDRHSLVAYEVGDLDELLRLGKRLSYLSITATRTVPADATPYQLLKVYCAKEGCWIEATNPDPEIRGVIGDLKSFAEAHPLLPSCYPPSWFSNVDYSLMSRVGFTFIIPIVILVAGGVILAVVSSVWKHAPSAVTGLLAILVIGLPAMLVLAGVLFLVRPTTVLQTATRAEAPTFLQRRGGDIAIAFVIAAVFYVVGAVTSH
jgi:hypothetical protein